MFHYVFPSKKFVIAHNIESPVGLVQSTFFLTNLVAGFAVGIATKVYAYSSWLLQRIQDEVRAEKKEIGENPANIGIVRGAPTLGGS